MSKGVLYGLSAYVLWGLLPIYWKQLLSVPAQEVVAHRIVWSLIFLAILHMMRDSLGRIAHSFKSGRVVLVFFCSSVLLCLNWGIYIWAVQANRIIDASLGYFITPIINIILGLLLLKERLSRLQATAVILVFAAVVYLTVLFGAFPWISLALAVTFGLYGYAKKQAPLNSLDGLFLETLLLGLPAAGYLLMLHSQARGSLTFSVTTGTILLVCSGIVTSVPLLLFGAAARRVTMITIGILQYSSPSLQFLLGVLLYREPFSMHRLVGFIFIWSACALYVFDSVKGYYLLKRADSG